MTKKQNIVLADERPRVLLLGVFTPENKMAMPQYYFDEFISLVDTLGTEYDIVHCVTLRSRDRASLLTKGKLEELKAIVEAENIDEIICSELISPLQERNLEDNLNVVVIDREQLILQIFEKHAVTAEGKIQVQVAAIEFLKTRMAGKGKDYAQQAGFIGGRGPGESEKEKLRRHFEDKIRQSKKHLKVLERARDNQRKQRLSSALPLIGVVGYTNAGKSSLINRLTKSDILAENKLFATLDVTTRELFIGSTKRALMSDTVGFISNLPHDLVDAFKSTLGEVLYADLLLHIVDLSNPAWEDQLAVVQETLKEIGAENKSVIYVFNKIDKFDPARLEIVSLEARKYAPHVFVSTLSKEGVATLVEELDTALALIKKEYR